MLAAVIVLSIIQTSLSHKSKFPVESGIGIDKMKKCLKQKLDIDNPDHICNNTIENILSNKKFIPSETPCISSVFDILPVQYCVGSSVVNCKKHFFETMIFLSEDKFNNFQNKNPTPAMLFYKNGSDTELGIYVFDHQHLSLALATSDVPYKLKYLKLCLIHDMRKRYEPNEMDLFWQYMIDKGYSYPYDSHYNYKNPIQYMPSSILQLVDDPFRSLASYVQDYMGFIYCPNPQEDVNALNFSRCFGQKGIKWTRKYGNVGLQLIWSQFFFRKLNDTVYVQKLYENSDTLYQVEIFRKLLPIAMNIALNTSDHEVKKLPSWNNQPSKVTDLNDLILYDNGCDEPLQLQIEAMNHTRYDEEDMMVAVGKIRDMSLLGIYVTGVCIVGVVAVLFALKRYYHRKIQISEHYSLNSVPINGYGSTVT